jgi:hypothetical protein
VRAPAHTILGTARRFESSRTRRVPRQSSAPAELHPDSCRDVVHHLNVLTSTYTVQYVYALMSFSYLLRPASGHHEKGSHCVPPGGRSSIVLTDEFTPQTRTPVKVKPQQDSIPHSTYQPTSNFIAQKTPVESSSMTWTTSQCRCPATKESRTRRPRTPVWATSSITMCTRSFQDVAVYLSAKVDFYSGLVDG